jgi:hypothetical protein
MSWMNVPANSNDVLPGVGIVSPASHHVAGTSVVVVSGVAFSAPSTI